MIPVLENYLPAKDNSEVKQKTVLAIIGLVIVLAGAPSLYFYFKYRDAQKKLADPTQYAQEEVRLLVEKVGKLIELPADEQPTIANITDVEKLSSQPFFASAQNGDKLLIYTNARKAFLYRPSTNKIIEVAPVNLGGEATPSAQNAGATSPALTPRPIRFVLYNGTTVVGLTKKFESKLVGVAPGAVVLERENAKKRDYTKTILIDMTGKKGTEAEALGSKLGISVAALPQGEATASADFVIIVGSDYD